MNRSSRVLQSIVAFGLAVALISLLACSARAETTPVRYDIVWDSPSQDHSGSMPLGNGDIGLNAWIEPTGDLVFYISKTDAWDDNGRLAKLGRVRVTLDPPPPTEPFEQTLSLRAGALEAVYGQGDVTTTLRVWVDANHPVIQVDIDAAAPTTATAAIELWRTEPYNLKALQASDLMTDRSKPEQLHQPVVIEPDTVLTEQADRIGWFHHNAKSVGPATLAKIQGLDALDRVDPLLHRTFGAVITADGAKRTDDTHLTSSESKTHRFSIHVVTRHPATSAQWLAAVEEVIAEAENVGCEARRAAHAAWWAAFWDRSWIHVETSDATVPTSLVPENNHRVRVGVDQSGGSRFSGQFGRVSIISEALDDSAIAALAQTQHEEPITRDRILFSAVPKAGDGPPNSETWSFTNGLTIEAWIKSPNGGRLVDKITVGGADGLLFDTHSRNGLRLIVGDRTLHNQDALPAGQWTHVAATVNNETGHLKMFVNGEAISAQTSERLDEALVVSRAYALQRYVDACAGRGRYPIKFNGSIFTVPYGGDPDWRRWGPGYWWQNTRLPYLSMCAAGDFEMMRPLFRMYADELLPLHKFRTKLQTGADGAFIPECIYFFGDQFAVTYGWKPIDQRGEDKLQESGWHKWEWVSGPELVFMMLDYYDHTRDEAFLRNSLAPTAREILTFFDSHYPTNDEGELLMHPAMACETWWDCTNPMPELAGLHAVTARLLALPHDLTTTEDRAFLTALKSKLPELPTREVGDKLALAPATKFARKSNIENPELYAVFPFRLVSFEKENVDLAMQALKHRWDRGNIGWRQEELFMAYLGLADDARTNLVGRARNYDRGSRFPAFWGPNYDWIPDQDHGGVLTRALQVMLMQTDPYSDRIFLLPAWPRDWNASFKLHASKRTIVECEYRDGEIRRLEVRPEERRKDIVLPREIGPAK